MQDPVGKFLIFPSVIHIFRVSLRERAWIGVSGARWTPICLRLGFRERDFLELSTIFSTPVDNGGLAPTNSPDTQRPRPLSEILGNRKNMRLPFHRNDRLATRHRQMKELPADGPKREEGVDVHPSRRSTHRGAT